MKGLIECRPGGDDVYLITEGNGIQYPPFSEWLVEVPDKLVARYKKVEVEFQKIQEALGMLMGTKP